MSSVKKPFQRLPTSVLPKNYKLTLQPNLTEFTFTGEEVIDVEVKQETDKVIINCLDVNVTSASFCFGEQSYPSSNISHCVEDETVEISFASPLPLGQGELCLDFTGELNNKLKGFYRCKYTGEDGSEKFCAVTHFEPTGARRAFPCWDEPAIRATFDITLIVPKDRVALSNMNVKEEKDHAKDTSLKVVKYARTPVMSTYLVAFVVGEFDFVEGRDANGVTIRVYTPKGREVRGQFALEVAKKCLPFYKEYFGIGYLLPKLDLIAIQDFVIGAMENWGLVTYRETFINMYMYVYLLVAKKCLPFYKDYFGIGYLLPKLDLIAIQDFVIASISIFCNRGYGKLGSCHLQYVGDQDFRKGLNHYLKTFEYSAASTEDLWASLSHASSKPVADVMETWTKQMGYPVLSVTAEQKGEDVVVTITQNKFSADGTTEDSSQWKVPIAVCTSTSPSAPAIETLSENKTCEITVSGVGKDQWIKLNPGQVGFYRVQYSSDMLELLLPAIKDNSLPPRDRLGLQSDLFALAQAGLTSTTEFLKLAEQFGNETNYTVWNDLTTNMSSLSKLLQNTGFYSSFQAFCVKLYENIAQKVGWDPKAGEGHLDALLRGLVLGCMGRSGDQATLTEARKRFEAHCKGESTISADLRSAVYSTVLKHGDDNTLESVMNLFKEADLHEEKVRLMRCMGAVSQPDLIKKVLEFSMSSDVRSQDTVYVIAGVTGSLAGRELAWRFVEDNWDELYTRYAGGLLFSRLIKMTTDSFATEKSLKEIKVKGKMFG
ncbi:puromycin-sensitive aminopeptidase-like [Pocillopora damicornis]|uniref:puromycin-sensitive aminopeptidase-like n=1 Tax=Pocillopora damicornis TaxID=46731 RepID=UPI000F554A10|nr:puromycin-sensitive aminopeptidase-like [Pocillopora damicornis]